MIVLNYYTIGFYTFILSHIRRFSSFCETRKKIQRKSLIHWMFRPNIYHNILLVQIHRPIEACISNGDTACAYVTSSAMQKIILKILQLYAYINGYVFVWFSHCFYLSAVWIRFHFISTVLNVRYWTSDKKMRNQQKIQFRSVLLYRRNATLSVHIWFFIFSSLLSSLFDSWFDV